MSKHSQRFKMLRKSAPVRMWIDGTAYNIRSPQKIKNKNDNEPEYTLHDQHELYNISKDDNGKLSTKFRLPSAYYIKLYSQPDYNIDSIQKNTNTVLEIPKHGKDGDVLISGEDYNSVARAREEMHNLCSQIRHRYPPMQFLSIPTLSEEVQNNFNKMKEEILNSGVQISGMEKSIFQKAEKLHLTIAVFSLLDDIEKEEAKNVLNSYKEQILDPQLKDRGPLNIKLHGIECMDDNYKKTGVLFAKAKFEDETEDFTLQSVANGLAKYFCEKGFCRECVDNVKIHVTLINTKYRNSRSSPKRFKRIPFDATYIMEKYRDYDFGVSPFSSIHLSLMSSKGEDGFYEPLTVINI